jgi:hypothetical protein
MTTSKPPGTATASSSSSSVFRKFDDYGDDNDVVGATSSSATPPPYEFTFKYQYSIQNNPLCGIEFPQWISLLKRRRNDIEWSVYWPRLVFVSIMSIFNSIMGTVERAFYRRKIDNAIPNDRPVFIIGHPRTGTTLLHSLLALDTQQFTYCSTFCAGFPSCFLWFERYYGKRLLKGVMAETRPMDNIRLDFDLPQEDELATCVLSGGTSPYMPLYFMTKETEFRPYYAFDDDYDNDTGGSDDENIADPSVMAAARKCWVDAFMLLIRKLTVRDELQQQQQQQQQQHQGHQSRRRLVLKSPVHTARIHLLRQLFPAAQFIYIHRHPYDVLRSAIHMADTTYWYTYLSRPTNEQIMEFIIRQYEILYDRYIAGRNMLLENVTSSSSPPPSSSPSSSSPPHPPQPLVEVSFDELSASPIETMQKIYDKLGWNCSSEYKKKLQNELGDIQSYQRNVHRPLPSHLKRIVNERWGPSFEMFGYTMDET